MSLKTTGYLSPNGDAIVAVLVLTPGSCGIVGIKADGTPEFDGTGTVHFYDDQYELTRDGKTVFVCDEGERWTFDQLVSAEPTLSIVPMHEPDGEGNGWHDCKPEEATLWVIHSVLPGEEAYPEQVDAFDTEEQAQARLKELQG